LAEGGPGRTDRKSRRVDLRANPKIRTRGVAQGRVVGEKPEVAGGQIREKKSQICFKGKGRRPGMTLVSSRSRPEALGSTGDGEKFKHEVSDAKATL